MTATRRSYVMISQQTIRSEDISVGDLFKDYYLVPNFQREYVWQESHVNQLLYDVYSEFVGGDGNGSSEYFIGSMTLCPSDDGMLQLIDGQQRMTTLYLFLCATRDHLKEANAEPIKALEAQIAAAAVDKEGRDVYRYRVVLQYEDSRGVLEQIAGEGALPQVPVHTRSVVNISNAYQSARSFIRNEFGQDCSELRKFYAFFTNNVKLIRIHTLSVARALKVFETINDRGVGLDSMDLLKNLMFMKASRTDFAKLSQKWKQLVDTLFKAREKPLRFLRYFIFSEYKVDRLREDQIYQWFTDNAVTCGYDNDPFRFVDCLIEAAKAYSTFLAGRNIDGSDNRYLANMRYLSGAARQHLILLLAGRHLTTPVFVELSRNLENLFCAYVIAREPTREFERSFAQWAPDLRAVRDETGLHKFMQQSMVPAKEALARRFALAFSGLDERAIQKYRLKYILAKLTQHIEERAWGSSDPQTQLKNYIGHEVEHILPQHPSERVVEAFDDTAEIVKHIHALGNLTLIEKTINCSIGAGTYGEKKRAYEQSKLLLTKSLAARLSVGHDTAFNRAAAELPAFDVWTSKSIQERQKVLGNLAARIWEIPEPSSKTTE
jgi:hypothetical protein